jgi:acetoin utilization deacetylase AcuC-like enzyme
MLFVPTRSILTSPSNINNSPSPDNQPDSDTITQGGAGAALIRPPGLHAGKGNAEGCCFTNHLALTVESIRTTDPDARFLAVDFDVHFGNGISDIYCEDASVFYFSQHGPPAHIYPFSGQEEERGSGEGEGFTRNITLPLHADGNTWVNSFNENLHQIATEFQPNYLLVSAGFDAHREDPFSLMRVEDEHYISAARELKAVATTHCQGRMGMLLEGGYSTQVLQRLVPEFITELSSD